MATKHKYQVRVEQFAKKDRSVILCLDGTWCDPAGADELADSPFMSGSTNARRFYDTVLRDDEEQLVLYIPDMTPLDQETFVGQLLSGTYGNGAQRQIAEAYVTLVMNYRPGDRFYILGMGRSAAIAIAVADLLNREGIPTWLNYSKDDRGRIVSYEFGCPFKGGGATHKPERIVSSAEIEMLGLWDTVAELNVPKAVIGIPLEVSLLENHDVSPNVKHIYHAVGIDEKRDVYKPFLINDDNRLEEVWFIGVHNTVGGGYDNRALSDISLRFMIDRAHALGIEFHLDSAEEITDNISGFGVAECEQRGFRGYGLSDRIITVLRKNVPDPSTKPRIHYTVFERMKRKPEYSPANVHVLNGAYSIAK